MVGGGGGWWEVVGREKVSCKSQRLSGGLKWCVRW